MWMIETRYQMVQLVLKRSLEETRFFERNLMPAMIWESGWQTSKDPEKRWKILPVWERTWFCPPLKLLVGPLWFLEKSLGVQLLPHTQ